MLIIFQLVIDLPASILLLIGANLRIKQLLVPWMLIMAVKMLGYVIACCIFVQFVYFWVDFLAGWQGWGTLLADVGEPSEVHQRTSPLKKFSKNPSRQA